MTSAMGTISISISVTITLSAMSAMTSSTHALSSVTGKANVYPTGAEAIGTAGQLFMWSDVLPNQTPGYVTQPPVAIANTFNPVTPSQTPNWINELEAA